ncbi:MAG: MucR family transcriptional regulator [Candidatus Methylomirabilales bacterium]
MGRQALLITTELMPQAEAEVPVNPFLTPRRRKRKYVPVAYYRTHILEAIREEDVVCLECGGLFRALPSHLRLRHHLLSEDYKAKWGYNRTTGLISKDLSERLAAMLNAMRDTGRLPLRFPGWVYRTRAATKPGSTWRMETKLRRKTSARVHALHRRLQKVSDEELIQLTLQGLGSSKIAKHTGVHHRAVRRRLAKLRTRGVTLPRPKPRANPPNRKVTDEELLTLLGQGLTYNAIAEPKGIAPTAIQKRVRRLRARGVPIVRPKLRPNRPNRKITDEELIQLRAQGLTNRAIAKRKGVVSSAISLRLKKLRARGMQLPPPPPRPIPHNRKVTNEELIQLSSQGLNSEEIGRRTGIGSSSVRTRLARLRARGVVLPRPKPRANPPNRKVTDEELIQLTQQGLGAGKIAKRKGMHRAAVQRRLAELRARYVTFPLPARSSLTGR